MPPKTKVLTRKESPPDKSICAPNVVGVCIPIASRHPRRTNTGPDQQKLRRRVSEKPKSRQNSLQQNLSSEQSSSNNNREDSIQRSSSFEQQVSSGIPPLIAREIPIM